MRGAKFHKTGVVKMYLAIVFFSFVVGFIAVGRGRNFFGYLLMSLVLTPIFGIFVLLCLRDLKREKQLKKTLEEFYGSSVGVRLK